MIQRIIGAFIIIGSCFGFAVAIQHLIGMMKIPKEDRIWWGFDVVIQLTYPIYIFGMIVGIYQFMV